MKKKILGIATSVVLSLLIVSCEVFSPMTKVTESFLPKRDLGDKYDLNLIFEDDFEGASLDEDKWIVAHHPRRNNYWHKDAVSVENGNLIIETKKTKITHTGSEPFTTWFDNKEHQPGDELDCYVSGCVSTKQRFVKGFFTAKMKVKQQTGHWNAFWLFCDESMDNLDHNSDGVSDSKDGIELDILECPANGTFWHCIHWNSGVKEVHGKESALRALLGYKTGWYLMSLLWTDEEYIFYVNGIESWRTKATGSCEIPLEMIFSDEINNGKSWGGDIRFGSLPDTFEIDYVRVYELVDKK